MLIYTVVDDSLDLIFQCDETAKVKEKNMLLESWSIIKLRQQMNQIPLLIQWIWHMKYNQWLFDSLNMIYCQNTLTKFYVQVQYLCKTKTLKVVYLIC